MDDPTPDDFRQQLLTRLRNLREAGVDWLPLGPPLERPAPQIPQSTPVQPESPALEIELVVASNPVLSLDERRLSLQMLVDEVKACVRCADLCSTRTQTVFGQGDLGVELCFVGEAPGEHEDAQGIPFVGPAGQLLNRILIASGFQREEVYICNILKCRPPNNRTPLADEAHNCRDFLDRQLRMLQA